MTKTKSVDLSSFHYSKPSSKPKVEAKPLRRWKDDDSRCYTRCRKYGEHWRLYGKPSELVKLGLATDIIEQRNAQGFIALTHVSDTERFVKALNKKLNDLTVVK